MSEKKQIEENPFLMRGCSQEPSIGDKIETFFKHSCCKLDAYDWLKDIPLSNVNLTDTEYVEVRFKNDRKEFFRKTQEFSLHLGDVVAVEASPGHDIGIVTLSGEIVKRQMTIKKAYKKEEEIKKIYRKARTSDIEKWKNAVKKEKETQFKSRVIVDDLKLEMKINDVEYQGDDTKAIFYYTAEGRVDFRELIKILAEKFHIRIEMRQIGARQEAGKLGGIGSCGRELCCSSWMTEFCSVTTGIARAQQLSLNPQKLAGQCGKLKCCLNYEYDNYVDALKNFPSQDIDLKTKKGKAFFQKADVFDNIMWYAYHESPNQLIALTTKSVDKIQQMNKKNKAPKNLEEFATTQEKQTGFEKRVEEDDLRRFDD
jgi:cell fate regulator YaaT (PSP1 superfamily)